MILLTDTFLANSSEPWRMPDVDDLPEIDPDFAERPERTATSSCPTCATSAAPGRGPSRARRGSSTGSAGSRRRTARGNISYDPQNHALMTELRAEQGRGASPRTSRRSRSTPTRAPSCWCSAGARPTARSGRPRARVRERGQPVATAHLRHLNPLPPNTGEVAARLPEVLVPEMNIGQLCRSCAHEFLVDAEGYNKVEGLPIFAEELER